MYEGMEPLVLREAQGRGVKAYLRIDPLIDERKADYSPAQLGAFLKLLALAARQQDRGRFRSMKLLYGVMPTAFVRHVPFLLERGDLIEHPDGLVTVEGWDDWQEGDLTVRDRMARLRNRQRNSCRNGGVTEPSPTATRLGLGSGVSSSLGVPPLRGTGTRATLGAADTLERNQQ